MRAELAEVFAKRGLMVFLSTEMGRWQGFCTHYQFLGVLWIGKRDRKEIGVSTVVM